ncbi:MAG TPA: autotransporter-associated beta strand repeat-containing protein, partial [Terrimicrobiaceae bacterium]|nr:autotransporter-associated beta strand repeat-containing protein [Terrimicrobiaceae bacterium]
MTATGPLSLQNSSGTVEGGMNRALANLSSIVAGANMTSGVPAGNFTSLTVGSDINLSVASASLSFMNSSAAPVSTGAMTVTVNGNVNIGAGTSLYLGAIIESGTSSLSPLALNGFTANSTEAGKGQINVNGKLMLNRNTTNVTLGDVNVGAAGVVTLTGAGASDLAQTGTFNKSIQARSLTGSGVVQNSIVTSGTSGVTTSNATLVLNTLASTDATFSGVLQNGSGANAVLNLTVSGSGRQTLTGANTYTGSTAINAGTLIVGVSGSGSLGNTAVSVNNGGTLAGSGAIAGSVTVNAGGILSPGNSPGTQEYGSLGLNGGGNYNWQIYDAAGSAGATNGWDLIEVAGELNLNALTDSNRFNINLWSLSGIGPDVHGDAL